MKPVMYWAAFRRGAYGDDEPTDRAMGLEPAAQGAPR